MKPFKLLLALCLVITLCIVAYQLSVREDALDSVEQKETDTPWGKVGEIIQEPDSESNQGALSVKALEANPTLAGNSDIFEEARIWLEAVGEIESAVPESLLNDGRRILENRMRAIERLIVSDPERALKLALNDTERAFVPKELREFLETPIRAKGDLMLGIACSGYHEEGKHPESEMWREAYVDGERYKAHTFGDREEMLSMENVPLDGIAIDDQAAFYGNPLRVLQPGDAGYEVGEVRVQFGDQILQIPNRMVYERARELALEAEHNAVGPVVTYPDLLAELSLSSPEIPQ